MKKRWPWILCGVCIYLTLLRLLVFWESASADASITSMANAVWFSLVTLTTAGYGDLYPVTAGGRLVGVLFLLMSTGFLAVLVSAAVLTASGRLIPHLRLLLGRRRRWYIFPHLNRESAALAQNLALEQPKALLIFCGKQADGLSVQPGWLLVDGTPEEVLHWRRNTRGCTLLILGPDSLDNLDRARAIAGWEVPVCCQSGIVPQRVPDSWKLFDRWESCARLYWQRRPLERGETQVALCGAGRYAGALLEQALLVNVFPPRRRIVYHVFGPWEDFLRDHPQLGRAVDVDGTGTGGDQVFFHRDGWDACPEVLSGADRILLCADADEENLDMFRRIRRYVSTDARLSLRLSRELEGEAVFGTDRELFTPELVLRTKLDRAAMAMHEIYRRSVGGQAPAWGELSDFLRRSNLAAADHLLAKVRLLLEDDTVMELTAENCRAAFRRWQETREDRAELYREVEHIRWMRFHLLNNWAYAPARNNALRQHPALLPYDRLPPAEQAKDDYAWELLGALADRLETIERSEENVYDRS